ncbi:hypothetical protein ACNCSK_004527 [Escherichia coli]|uniref:hypothetical protein n=1 Tax=Escherichia coli TaxID=562 RepID=UPI001100BA3A|nr:hypothetical protein [Escherichia coli]EDC6115500.1 hypothetical protein [Salmonella enterica subsp. enterica serovar Java]EFX7813870.1 hypothetical protein [Shigella sonnei]EGN9433445.1 hypothetical protein [Salmonella enterica]EIX8546762.1 hypothetical protein [Salmonella enterica]EJN0250022.1 hypothetical protein [Salmonella enterica]
MLKNAMADAANFFISLFSNPASLACIILLIAFIAYRIYREPELITWVIAFVFIAPGVYIALYALAESENQDAKEAAEREQWFSQHCQIVEKREGSTSLESGLGVSANGKLATGVFTNSTPDQTAYKCDDGVTYWRNK